MAVAGQETAKPGRPRSPDVDQAILRATIERLARHGYARMTVDAIATDAGVTRPTIYRRWPTKADLTVAAISDLVSREAPVRTGDTRTDLIEIVRAVYRAVVEQNRMSLFGSIFAEDHDNPDFVRLFRKHVLQPRRRQFAEVLEAGIAKQEIDEAVDVQMVTDFLIGSFLSRWMTGSPVPRDWPERTVALVWAAIARVPGDRQNQKQSTSRGVAP